MGDTTAQPSRERFVTPAFCLLFVSSFATTCAYYLTMTLMARYALETFACSETAAGLAASVFMVGGVVGRIVSMQIPSTRTRAWSIISMVVMLVAMLGYFAASIAYPILLVVRIVHGLAFGVTGTLVPALAMEKMPVRRLGEGTGYFTLSVTLGTAIGPMIGLLSTASFNWTLVFSVVTGIVVIGLLATIAAPVGPSNARPSEQIGHENNAARSKHRFTAADLVDPTSWKLTLFMFILAIGYMPINAFISNYAAELGMGHIAPFIFLVYAACLLVTRPFAGRIMDTRSAAVVLAPSIASMAVGLIVCAGAQNEIMLLLVGVFMATGFGTSISVAQAEATKLSGQSNASKAIATLFLFADGGAAIGPVLMGAVASAAGFRIMYIVCAAMACLGLAYYWFIGRKVKRQAPAQN